MGDFDRLLLFYNIFSVPGESKGLKEKVYSFKDYFFDNKLDVVWLDEIYLDFKFMLGLNVAYCNSFSFFYFKFSYYIYSLYL